MGINQKEKTRYQNTTFTIAFQGTNRLRTCTITWTDESNNARETTKADKIQICQRSYEWDTKAKSER